jgi:RNA polymerase sigma factor (sigma-70 family)
MLQVQAETLALQAAGVPGQLPGAAGRRPHDENEHATSRNPDSGRLQVMTGKQPFDAVVVAHGATVLRVCRAVLGPADADDAWSEAFLAAMKAYPDLPADANVEAWLVTIAHRKAIDVTRAAARRAIPVAEIPAAGDTADHGDLGLDGDLAEALTSLPARQKQAVAYHYLAGLPYADVAAILGGTDDSARRAAADGIARLRRSWPGPHLRSKR